MKILLHVCCAPCAIYPRQVLTGQGMTVMGYFYQSNIHPYSECLKRRQAVERYSHICDMRFIYQEEYNLEGFLRGVAFRESNRCLYCYHERLRSTALLARRGKFDYFTTTLLYSKFQKHQLIREMGEAIGKSAGVPFYYHDFREGWKEGIAESKRLNLYRQQYCGCVYSEKERFYKD
ncbi:MAG: epoxyqueuosine reductase QueH [Desulfosudaceae bacterium]